MGDWIRINEPIYKSSNFSQFFEFKLKFSSRFTISSLTSRPPAWLHLIPVDDAVPVPNQGRSGGGCINQSKEILAKEDPSLSLALGARRCIDIDKSAIIASCDKLYVPGHNVINNNALYALLP